MIPLRDNVRIYSFPIITLTLILINCYLFYLELTFPAGFTSQIINNYGLAPARFIAAVNTNPFDYRTYISFVTCLFLHGGWLHIIGNLWYLWLFGRSSEACLGHLTYLKFYLLCGVIAGLCQIIAAPDSPLPLIGASGAISGILGSYIICFPRAKITMLVPLFVIYWTIDVPAIIFVGLWFYLQFQQGVLAITTVDSDIAWWAHIGGFTAGILLSLFLKSSKRARLSN